MLAHIGNIYIADTANLRIRKITASTGIITTIAGNGGTGSFSGDGGAATSAKLNGPYGVGLDSSGSYSYFFIFYGNFDNYFLVYICRQRVHRRYI